MMWNASKAVGLHQMVNSQRGVAYLEAISTDGLDILGKWAEQSSLHNLFTHGIDNFPLSYLPKQGSDFNLNPCSYFWVWEL